MVNTFLLPSVQIGNQYDLISRHTNLFISKERLMKKILILTLALVFLVCYEGEQGPVGLADRVRA